MLDLTDVSEESIRQGASFEINGGTELARLEAMALNALVRTGKAKEAHTRLKRYRRPFTDAALHFARAMVLVDNADYVSAAEEIGRATELDDHFVRQIEAEDIPKITLLHEKVPKSFALARTHALMPVYCGKRSQARSLLDELTVLFPKHVLGWYDLWNLARSEGWGEVQRRAAVRVKGLRPSSDRELWLQCVLFHDEKMMSDVARLAEVAPHSTVPLRFLLRVAEQQGNSNRAKEFAHRLLEIDPGDEETMACLMNLNEKDSEQYVLIADQLSSRIWVDFHGREYVARKHLEGGRSAEAKRRCESLIEDGATSLQTLILYEIVSLSTGRKASSRPARRG